MEHRERAPRKRMLAAAVVAVLVSGASFTLAAQTPREQEQDRRIAHLEAELRELRDLVTQPQPESVVSTQGTPSQAKPILATSPPGAQFTYGGFIKLDAMSSWTSDGPIADSSAGRLFYFPGATPVGNGPGQSFNDMHAQFSRIWFSADRTTDAGDVLKGYVELDFFSGGNTNVGNEKTSNGFAPTLRHAYVSWNRWLAGQTWSNFMDPAALPESVDFVGVSDGTVFVRQAQLRYTRSNWSVAVENPQTWYHAGAAAHIASGENNVPDVTAKWQMKGERGHLSVSGLARQLRARDETDFGYGLSVAGSTRLGERDALQYMVSGGRGIGRYLSFGIGADAVFDAGSLDAQEMYAGFLGWRHSFSPSLRSTLAYSIAHIPLSETLVGAQATERTQSVRANLIYSPLPKLDIGGEVSWAQRELTDGARGEMTRLHTTVKYSF